MRLPSPLPLRFLSQLSSTLAHQSQLPLYLVNLSCKAILVDLCSLIKHQLVLLSSTAMPTEAQRGFAKGEHPPRVSSTPTAGRNTGQTDSKSYSTKRWLDEKPKEAPWTPFSQGQRSAQSKTGVSHTTKGKARQAPSSYPFESTNLK